MRSTLALDWLAWVTPHGRQELPLNDALVDVELEQSYCGRPLRCDRFDKAHSQSEVILPTLPPRVKEAYKLAILSIDRTDIGSLPRIAANTSVSEVISVRSASMFAADDVIDLMGRIRILFME